MKIAKESFSGFVLHADEIEKYFSIDSTNVVIDLSQYGEASIPAIEALENLYNYFGKYNINCEIIVSSSSILKTQFDFERMHRKFKIRMRNEFPQVESLELVTDEPDDEQGWEYIQAWRGDPEKIVKQLESETISNSIYLIRWIIQNEEFLYAKNKISPYTDLIPMLIERFDPYKLAKILDHLEINLIIRLFFNDYTVVKDEYIAKIVDQMEKPVAIKLFEHMANGVDFPIRMSSILFHLKEVNSVHVLEHLSITAVLKSIKHSYDLRSCISLINKIPENIILDIIIYIFGKDSVNKISYIKKLLSTVTLEAKFYIESKIPDKINKALKEISLESVYCVDLRDVPINFDSEILLSSSGFGDNKVICSSTATIKEITESIDFIYGRKKVVIHTVEINPEDFSVECYMSENCVVGYDIFSKILNKYLGKKNGPSKEDFENLGLFQLSNELSEKKIDFAINGNFYFDYGHYEYGKSLNIPLEKSEGLCFGSPVGLFASKGKVFSPATYNRGSFIINDSGEASVERVKLKGITANGKILKWSAENVNAEEGKSVLFTNIFGIKTPEKNNRIDYVIVSGKVVSVYKGGGAFIPFTGFVVSVDSKSNWNKYLNVGTEVDYIHNYSNGKIIEAIGCGPLLTQNGEISVNFSNEDFGMKDSSVMSFFLPRQFESYEAARSFIGVKKNKNIIFGTVSGCSFGGGVTDYSAGMTFGEMAVLCKDLGLESSMGLDGGGSSSIVRRNNLGLAEVLNIPTGGKDVPRGMERYISTALFFKRKK